MNGWSNRETWTINLWLTNDAATLALAEQLAREADSEIEVADRLESYFAGGFAVPEGLVADLVSAAMARVDWTEIARSIREA